MIEEEKTLEKKIKMYEKEMPKIRFERFELEYARALEEIQGDSYELEMTELSSTMTISEKAIRVAKLCLGLESSMDYCVGRRIVRTVKTLEEVCIDKEHKVYEQIREFTKFKIEELKEKLSFEDYDRFMEEIATVYLKD